jgi:predicted aldo/keto reductase-like oxidoreductase
MIYRKLGNLDVDISVIAMGGHEYLPSGESRGFNENFELAVQPNYLFEGFGQVARKQVLTAAIENGINFFDVTLDSEKEALGRNLREVVPPYEIYVQTRPEGMAYTYDPYNEKMAKYELLKAEVQRMLKLLRRERIDFLNLPFMQAALDHDPEYLKKISNNIQTLKKEGLIRFACADTFSGEYTYLKQIEAKCFDAVYINFNFGDCRGAAKVLPLAHENGMGVITRETYMKGKLFKMAEEAGITDKSKVASAALKWSLTQDSITTAVYGTGKVKNLLGAIDVLRNLVFDEEDARIIAQIKKTKMFKAFEASKDLEFTDSETTE